MLAKNKTTGLIDSPVDLIAAKTSYDAFWKTHFTENRT